MNIITRLKQNNIKITDIAQLEALTSMTSTDIAKMTGKRHSDVLRDIRVMFSAIDEEGSKYASIESSGLNKGKVKSYHLSRLLCRTLISGYSIEY